MGGEVKAYNSGKHLDLNVMSGGGDIATLGGQIFGSANNQKVDNTEGGGNRIMMHAQTGGSKNSGSLNKTKKPKRSKGYGKHRKTGGRLSKRPKSKKQKTKRKL